MGCACGLPLLPGAYRGSVLVLPTAFRFETKTRALTLLKQWLSPEQRACYERFRYFDVIGSDTGTRYRVHHGTQTNIEEQSLRDNVSANGAVEVTLSLPM